MTSKTFQIGPGFGLPATTETVTQTYALLGKRGAGKTTTAAVITENLLKAHAQVVVLDPLDGWFGLRLTADGKGPGFPIHVFGGRCGDLPLEAGAGALMADVVVDEGLSLVLSLAQLSKGDMRRFVTDFCERLYRRKAEPEHRTPLHVVMDEADLFVPQERHAGLERLIGAVTDLYLRGRSRGLGGTLITQRPARIHKDALSEVEMLVCHRLISPQDRKAVEAWIEAHDVLGQRREFMESLAGLPVGTAWFWSPGWLDVFQRVKVRARETFDSSATPTGAAPKFARTTLAPVDLARLESRMAATIEKAKAEDPRELRRTVARLGQELRELRAIHDRAKEKLAAREPKATRVIVPAVKEEQIARVEKLIERLRKDYSTAETWFQHRIGDLVTGFNQKADELAAALRAGAPAAPLRHTPTTERARAPQVTTPRLQGALKGSPGGPARFSGSSLPAGEHRVLTAIAQHGDAGVRREQLTILAGYRKSTRDLYVQRLRTGGHVDAQGDRLVATDAGVAALGAGFAPLPTGDALRAYWLQRLPEGERRLLQVLVDAHPRAVERDAISEAAGYRKSTRDLYLQRLAARRLVVNEGRGAVRAAGALFG
jgi:hypothetical protein